MVFRTRDSAPGSRPSSRPVDAPRRLSRSGAARRRDHAAALIRRCAAEALEDRTLFATFTVTNTNNSGLGSLRQAIDDANTAIGADIIAFDIGAGGAATIALTSQLPTITDPVLIDGTTQTGFTGAPIIEIDGSNAGGSADGFRITGGETTIRGIVIDDFSGWGITMSTDGGNVIVGNYIGTDITGLNDHGNGAGGILMDIGDNQIGGLGPDADDPTDDFLDANVISGNEGDGIKINSGSPGNLIINNLIGLDVTGTIAVGNDDDGIDISSDDNLIGDLDIPDRANTIANNGGDGVQVNSGAQGNAILSNSIFDNTDQGINLAPDDVNNNDLGDVDTGANNKQNYPILSSARFNDPLFPGQFTVQGTFSSEPNTTYRLQFFTGTGHDPNRHGEGQTFLPVVDFQQIDPGGTSDASGNIVALPGGDQLEVTTGSDGTIQFAVVLPGVPQGRHVTATATNLTTSDTSEFGLNVISGTTAGINIESGGNQIISGDDTPDPSDNTDFGSVFLDDPDGVANTYTIRNTGTAAIALTGNPRVQIIGPNAADFTVETQPSGVIDPDDTSDFIIRFIPSTVGLETATVVIPNTDPDENPYTFVIQATGAQRQITVEDTTVTEGNSGTTVATFTIDIDSPPTNDIVLSYSTSDGTATAGIDYFATSGTAVIPAGATSATVTVQVVGDTLFEGNETFNLNVTSLDATVAVADGIGTATIIDDEPAPSLSVSDVQTREGQAGTTNMVFTVSLSAPSPIATTVNYSTADGTATAGTDYIATSGVLTIPAGQGSATVTVTVLGDRVIEPDETLFLNLSAPSFATITDGQGIGTIVNDDATFIVTPPDISGAGSGVVVERAGGVFAPFTVALSVVTDEVVTVRYVTQDGSATANSDYLPAGGLLTFQPGEQSKTVPVFVTADTLVEGDENFQLTLFQPTNSALTQGSFPVTIRDSSLPFLTVDTRNPLTYTDANGDQVTVAIKGQGQANVQFANSSGVGNAVGLVVDGTNSGSAISINATGGGTTIGGVSINRNVKQVVGPQTDLVGDFSTLGTIKGVNFRSASGAGKMNLFVRGNTTVNFGRVENYNIESDSTLKSVTVGEWLDTDGIPDLIHAPGINTLTSRGDFSSDIVTGTLGKTSIAGALTSADFRPTVGIKQLTAGAIRDSNIFAGVNGQVDADRALPVSDADLFNDASFIKKLSTGSFSNSRIAANTMGTIDLGSIQSENANRQLGTAADKITKVTGSTNRGLITVGKTDGPRTQAEDDLLIRVY